MNFNDFYNGFFTTTVFMINLFLNITFASVTCETKDHTVFENSLCGGKFGFTKFTKREGICCLCVVLTKLGRNWNFFLNINLV